MPQIRKQKKDLSSHEHNEDEQQQQSLHSPITERKPESKTQASQQETKYTFGREPIIITCPFCHNRIKTELIMKPQLISIALGLLLFTILPNAVMIVAIVLVLQTTATRKHRCSLCERELGNDGKFLVVLKDEVYSFKLGDSGVLISKKILCTIAIFALMFLVIFARAKIGNAVDWTDLTWNQLIQQCPKSSESPTCNNANLEKTVKNWRGLVMRVQDRRDSMRRYYDYALEIYVKMQPTQTDNKTPDLYLTSSSSTLYQVSEVVDSLRHGDEIMFNATFFPIGRGIPPEAQNRHLQLLGMNKTGARDDSVQVYMKKKEQQYYDDKVEGKGLRQEKP